MKGPLQIITLFTELKLIKYISCSKMLKIFQFWHTCSTMKEMWDYENGITGPDKKKETLVHHKENQLIHKYSNL